MLSQRFESTPQMTCPAGSPRPYFDRMRNLTSIIVLGQALAMACGCGEAPYRGDGDDAYVYGEASHWDSNLTRDAPNGGNLDGGADASVDLSADGAGRTRQPCRRGERPRCGRTPMRAS